MEALQPPSAAVPAPGAQMAPERRGGAQEGYEPQRRTCRWHSLERVTAGVKPTVRTKAQRGALVLKHVESVDLRSDPSAGGLHERVGCGVLLGVAECESR